MITIDRFSYEMFHTFVMTSKKELAENAKKAFEYGGGYKQVMNEYVVIQVESYYCIAHIADEYEPIEIWDEVYPFDENRIYPMQKIQQKITFVY